MRPDKAADEQTAIGDAPPRQAQTTEPSFEERVAVAKQNQPELSVAPAVEQELQPEPAAPRPATRSPAARVLTIDEVRLNGTLQITDLHLDIHVYSDDPIHRAVNQVGQKLIGLKKLCFHFHEPGKISHIHIDFFLAVLYSNRINTYIAVMKGVIQGPDF